MTAEDMFLELGYNWGHFKHSIYYKKVSHLTGQTIEIVTFDLSKEEIAIDTNMENVIESDLLQAIIQQAKELGWLEEEKKTETNFQHYFECLSKRKMSDFALIDGRFTKCSDTSCSECDFNGDCIEGKFRWLKQPYKEPTFKLSKFEYDLINTYNDCRKNRKFRDCDQLRRLKNEGYFKCVNHDVKVQDVLKNCEVIE